jgi:ABC-type proline/glycine betaine transport system permease subunit
MLYHGLPVPALPTLAPGIRTAAVSDTPAFNLGWFLGTLGLGD